ncbi:MAG: hypothetical protein JST00_05415 [Deltaproteobacteria bacterium]|nr:hypothetical protein [Deltaproteobacteria bacterium]
MKAAPPPPPPSPPRKMSSGFSPKTSAAVAEALAPLDSDGERATAVAPYHREPPTLDRRGDAFDAPSVEVRDEDLPSTAAIPRGRVDAMVVTFDDETQARAETRPLDRGYDPATLAPSTAPVAADMNIPYDSLPSLEVRRPYDTYEAEFSERDPVTAMHGRRESAHIRRADVAPAVLPSNDLPSFEVSHAPHGRPSGASWGTFSSLGGDSAEYDRRAFNDPDFNVRAKRDAYDDGAYRPAAPPVNDYVPSVETEAPPAFGRREESGPRALPRNDYEPAPSSVWNDASDVAQHDAMGVMPTGFSTMPPSPEMVAPEHDSLPPVEPYIPPAPRVPAEAYGGGPSAFVMGVQPIRNNRTDAWPPAPAPMPAPEPMAPPPAHYQPQALPSPMQAMHNAPAAHPAYAQPQPYVHASPRNMNVTPQPGSLAPAVVPQGHATHRGQQQAAVAALGAPAPQQNRIGRFAWFVAGVAFGITFAIFATGFFAGGSVGASKAAASEPPAPAQTTIAQASAPPPVATTAQPVAVPAPPPVGTVAAATPSTLPPSGTLASPAAPVAPSASPKPAPIAKASPPVVVRRPAPPPQRRMPATTEARPVRSGGDDEAPSPRVAAPPPEAGDLLGAALR